MGGSTTPPAPPLGDLRIAGPNDIMRLGIVCTAGFRYAEQFTWERPYHAQHPLSTLAFFRHEVRQFIKSPEHIVLVAVDSFDTHESDKTEAVIPDSNGWDKPAPGTDVVVGMAIWKLEAGSKRVEDLPGPPSPFPHLPEYNGADMYQHRAKVVEEACDAAEKRFLVGLSSMERIVVHPAYWKRGHGIKLAKWGVDLAKLDEVDQGVLASSMGEALYEHVGFRRISNVHVDGDEEDPKGFDIAVMRYHVHPSC
ncbi:hypothetical protein QQS21_012850 [Conoideocrella luteorostrata]|uniref:N-acetyltransferase domain-containing protein n=1 Tax=Conoideocrella luteorostrata TaxID=1105319 RepID=A0AAJ0CD96_9HYPO|nr:hypothetical protein QQS21_012850 [Conoideocrella luteorostrata]